MNYLCLKKSFGKMRKTDVKKCLSNNKIIIMLSIFLLLGVLLGSVLVSVADENTMKFINVLFLSEFKERLSRTLLDIFIASISSTFVFVIISFFMGLSMWGFILAPIIPFIRGICIGISEGYLYSTYGLRGICFHSLVFLPGIFISSVAILLMTKEAMKISNNFSSIVFLENKSCNIGRNIRLYIIRSGCIVIIVIIASAVDLVFNFLFSRFFSF